MAPFAPFRAPMSADPTSTASSSPGLSTPPEAPLLLPAAVPPATAPTPPPFGWASLAGRLCELHGDARSPHLSVAFGRVHEAQQRAEPVVWIAVGPSLFFAPDAAAGGIDLEALPVVRVDTAADAARAADVLLRSGAFGLVVVDLGPRARWSLAVQNRLAGLARHHRSVLLCLTRSEARRDGKGVLDSPVSLRVQASLERREDRRFVCVTTATRDKHHGPGWRHEEICRGPDGLC